MRDTSCNRKDSYRAISSSYVWLLLEQFMEYTIFPMGLNIPSLASGLDFFTPLPTSICTQHANNPWYSHSQFHRNDNGRDSWWWLDNRHFIHDHFRYMCSVIVWRMLGKSVLRSRSKIPEWGADELLHSVHICRLRRRGTFLWPFNNSQCPLKYDYEQRALGYQLRSLRGRHSLS